MQNETPRPAALAEAVSPGGEYWLRQPFDRSAIRYNERTGSRLIPGARCGRRPWFITCPTAPTRPARTAG